MARQDEFSDDEADEALETGLREFIRSLDGIVQTFREKAAKPNPIAAAHFGTLCDDMDALLAEARHQALWSLQERGDVGPLFSLLSRHGMAVVLGLDAGMPASAEMQAMVAKGVAETIRIASVDACIFMMEAWLAPCSKDAEGEWIEDDIRPDEHPDKVEMVYIRASTPQVTALRVYEIERDGSGKASALLELDSEKKFGFTPDRLLMALENDGNPLLSNLYDTNNPAWEQGAGSVVH